MPDIHAKTCSPSGADGWFACAGRIVMEASFPNKDTSFSADGTARHTVVASCLNQPGVKVAGFVGVELDNGLAKVTYKPEWVDEDQDYVDTVLALAEGGELYVERVVNFETYTQVKGDSFGTADAIILKPSYEGGPVLYELIVVDRKTGYVEVPVERNKQLMLYALGALAEFGLVYDIARVRLVIHQRAAREWDCSIDELLKFGNLARSKAASVQNAIQMHGQVDAYKWNATFLNQDPSEDACRYCRAMATCPSMQAKVQEMVGMDFAVLSSIATPHDVKTVIDQTEDLGALMCSVSLVEDWCKSVRAETERRLLAGKEVPGFKLVLGKQGNRKWSDEAAAEQMLKTFRLKQEEMYDFTVISPTTAEKLAKTEAIGKRQWPKLQALITRSEPKPSVAPISDKRDAYVPPNAADDFAPIPETETAGLDLC